MAHVYYGDPTEEFSAELIRTLAGSGVDIVEVGIPSSDPTADGPVFTAACERALKGGMTPRRCIEGIARLREGGLEAPIVVTSYYNVIYSTGVGRFMAEVRKAGAQAVISPDVPFEESGELIAAGRGEGIDVILQVTPTTDGARLGRIAGAARGFIYTINVEGVTGARDGMPESALELIKRLKALTETPIMVGFGISRREQVVGLVSAGADGVVTGSAIAEIYARRLDRPEETLGAISGFAKGIKAACAEGNAQRKVA
ncbi:MAG: tryptophan synthase subunit alpha [Candidatus Methanosuratincola sp.]|jgi:tryptophan synthase alpha chain|nr:tryptophan synthase subunit alpha [Candidatus Methanosuratincola sp.]